MRQVLVYRIHCPACAWSGSATAEGFAFQTLWDHAAYAHESIVSVESDLPVTTPVPHTTERSDA